MPVALNPEKRFWLSVNSDSHLPDETRPAFQFRYASGREWMDIADIESAMTKSSTGRQALQHMYDAIRIALVDWRHMTTTDEKIAREFGVSLNGHPVELPYKPECLDLLLNVGEAKELLAAVMTSVVPTVDDLKN